MANHEQGPHEAGDVIAHLGGVDSPLDGLDDRRHHPRDEVAAVPLAEVNNGVHLLTHHAGQVLQVRGSSDQHGRIVRHVHQRPHEPGGGAHRGGGRLLRRVVVRLWSTDFFGLVEVVPVQIVGPRGLSGHGEAHGRPLVLAGVHGGTAVTLQPPNTKRGSPQRTFECCQACDSAGVAKIEKTTPATCPP